MKAKLDDSYDEAEYWLIMPGWQGRIIVSQMHTRRLVDKSGFVYKCASVRVYLIARSCFLYVIMRWLFNLLLKQTKMARYLNPLSVGQTT